MGRPLEGYRVLDVTNVLAGPFCSYQLALMGAEVIKVEAPGSGDLARHLGADPELNRRGMGASFLAQNAGKKSVTLNLKHPRGAEIFRRLAGRSDVLVENFRPGVMARLGVDYAALSQQNQRLVYCAISGFGQEGPFRARPAYDQIVQGLAGVMSITGDEHSAPLRVGFPVADTVGGLTAAFAVTVALLERERTGRGRFIDVSMLESTLVMMGWVLSNYLIAGQEPRPMGNENPTASPSGTFRTADGFLNIAANQQAQFESLCHLIGRDDLPRDPRYAEREGRLRHREELRAEIEAALARRSASDWESLLNERGVPAGRVLSVPEILRFEQEQRRGFLQEFRSVPGAERDVRVATTGFRLSGNPTAVDVPPPRLGEHTRQVLAELGYGPQEIDALRQEGVV